jgi:glucokinase
MTDVVVAMDLGGTRIKCAIVDADSQVLHTEGRPTAAERGPSAVVESILDVLAGLVDKARADGLSPRAIGVAVPGVVDEKAGIAAWSANVGFRDVPLRERVAAHIALPVALGHDVRAGGLAEARLGGGQAGRDVLFVAIGTGIAAAYIMDGRAYAGAHGAAGELGHIVVRPGGPLCGCGNRGCLEAVASATALARRYAALTASDPPLASTSPAGSVPPTATPSPAASANPGGVAAATRAAAQPDAPAAEAVSAAEVVALAGAGDPAAAQAWRETIDALADGLHTAQTLYDADVVVLGGGLAEAGEALLAPLRTALRARLTFQREPQLVRATLGDQAGCLGAALLALPLVPGTNP